MSQIVSEDKADCIHVHTALHMNIAHLYVRVDSTELADCTIQEMMFCIPVILGLESCPGE